MGRPRLEFYFRSWVAFCLVSASCLLLSATAAGQELVSEFGDPGAPEPARLGGASSISVDADGNPWVADLSNERIVKYDYSGGFVAEFKSLGEVSVTTPWGIGADDQGFLYVAQGSADPRLVKIDTGGRFVSAMRLEDATGTVVHPYKVAIDSGGRLFVSDSLRTIHVYDERGRRLDEIRLPSSWSVIDLTIEGNDLFATFSTGTPNEHGIVHYGTNLRRKATLGPYSSVSFGELGVDSFGRINVADYSNSLVRRFDREAGEIDQFGRRGTAAGEMNGPRGIAVDCRGSVYVLDTAARYDGEGGPRAGSKVMKFVEDPDAPPPPCADRSLPEGAIDTQINDVEVTQAVQPWFSHTAGPLLAPGQQGFTIPEREIRTREYGRSVPGGATGEVPLKAHLKTVVRVYANLNQGPAGGIANVPATLEARATGGKSLGSIQALARPPLLRTGDRTVSALERADPVGVYTFDLPMDWTTQGAIDLTAKVNPARIGCTSECGNRSTFRLTDVRFGTVREAPIAPVALTAAGQLPIRDPARAFALAQRVTPLLLTVQPYQAQAEVGDLLDATEVTLESCFVGVFPCEEDTYTPGDPEFREYLQGELMDRLEGAAEDAGIDRCDRVPIGLVRSNSHLPGAMRGEMLAAGLLPCAMGYATVERPLTAVAHELQHAFGRPHAGRNCPGTGADEDQAGEPWPPDDRGQMDGIGLNTYAQSRGSRGPHEIIAPGTGGRPSPLFDLMSYCAGKDESAAWISVRGWQSLSNWRVGRPLSRPVQAAVRGRRLRVTAIELSDGQLGITGVSPAHGETETVDPSSPYVLEALDDSGAVLASAPAAAAPLGDTTSQIVRGTVPAPPATHQVFLRRGTETGTRRVASPNPPKVRLRAPRTGERVGGPAVVVRWRATDPDGDDLSASVEYSSDGGRSWRGIYAGPSTERARISRAMLEGSKRARVRIRVDDGFNEAVATSKLFSVAPSPPLVRITDPYGKLTVAAGAALQLRGEAFAADGEQLGAKRLRWSDGRRRLGRGSSVTADSLGPGRHRITLAAVQQGMTGRAETIVVVRAVKPAFLRLDAPETVAHKARSIRLTVASTVAAQLRAGKRSFAVSPRARRLRVPIGRQNLLRLQLRAGALRTTQAISFDRR